MFMEIKFLDKGQWLLERPGWEKGQNLDGQVESGGRNLGWMLVVISGRRGMRRGKNYPDFF